jgi:dethiobiotin synthetase
MTGAMVFVTGTDTDVGKTVATAWLGWALSSAGTRIALIKPFQTGATDPTVDGDEATYRRALGASAGAVHVPTIRTLSALPEPLAPSIAAKRAGVALSPESIVRECQVIAAKHDVTLVEGAGGLLVSITDMVNMADFAARLMPPHGAPLVLVARPGLGTLNHTLLSVEAAKRRGLEVALLVVSGYPSDPTLPPSTVEAENLRYLRSRLPRIPLLVLGRANVTVRGFAEQMPVRLAGREPAWLSGLTLEALDVAAEVALAR